MKFIYYPLVLLWLSIFGQVVLWFGQAKYTLYLSQGTSELKRKFLALISKYALTWFTSYLTNRNQVMRINSTLSNLLRLNSGVPQGSILGPLLFSIYINDLPSVPRNCLTQCYVDDTKLQISFKMRDCPTAI